MLQTKKLNASMIAVVVLSVLLVMATAITGTLAWFASADSANNTLTMSGAVEIEFTEDSLAAGKLSFTIGQDNGGRLLPGKWISTLLQGEIAETNTGVLARAKLNLAFKDAEGVTIEGDTALKTTFKSLLALDAEWVEYETSGWFYYTAGTVGAEGTVKSIDASASDIVLNLISNAGAKKELQIPVSWTNNMAGITVEVTLTIQAAQDFIPSATDGGTYSETGKFKAANSSENVHTFFEAVFPV